MIKKLISLNKVIKNAELTTLIRQASTYHEHWQEHDVQKHMQWLESAENTRYLIGYRQSEESLRTLIEENIKTLNEVTKVFGTPIKNTLQGANQDVFKTERGYIIKLDPNKTFKVPKVTEETDVMTHFKSNLNYETLLIPIYVQELLDTTLSQGQMFSIRRITGRIRLCLDTYAMENVEDIFQRLVEDYGDDIEYIYKIPNIHPQWPNLLIKSIIKLYKNNQTDFHSGNVGLRKSGDYYVFVFFDA